MAPSALIPRSHYRVVAMDTNALQTAPMLESLPVELIEEIMKNLGPQALSRFVLLNKKFFEIFKATKATILPSVLLSQPEFETMMYLYVADERDFQDGQMLHPRVVDFDTQNKAGTIVNLLSAKKVEKVVSEEDKDDEAAPEPEPEPEPEHSVLNIWDMIELWKWLKVIDWWVDLWPSFRWRDRPEDRRCLRPHEEIRLRKALARWWLYAWHFHGAHEREVNIPHKWGTDKRLHHIRIMNTREICELEDLWCMVFNIISRDLCSSPERVCMGKPRGYNIELMPWGSEEGRHNDIVRTYLKLDPEQLKYFLELFYHRKKTDIIKAVRSSMRDFNLDRESLSYSISIILQERLVLKARGVVNIPRSGIIDEDRDEDNVVSANWNSDESPSGQPQLSPLQIVGFPLEDSRRLPRGDDGSDEPF